MNKTITINPKFSNDAQLQTLIEGLPESFESEGIMLWNKRNQIKDFGNIVVKRFKQPNWLQKSVYAIRKHKVRKAFENGLELIRRGFDTPEPMAAVELRDGFLLKEAYYFSRPDHAHGIKELTDRDDWNKPLATAFARFAAQLHQAGILHHDLNNTNVLYKLAGNGTDFHFSLIDINRMTFYPIGQQIPLTDCLENLTRFTGRMDLFEFVVREYAKARNMDEAWVTGLGVAQKKQHDRNWYRRKRFTRLFKKKKK